MDIVANPRSALAEPLEERLAKERGRVEKLPPFLDSSIMDSAPRRPWRSQVRCPSSSSFSSWLASVCTSPCHSIRYKHRRIPFAQLGSTMFTRECGNAD